MTNDLDRNIDHAIETLVRSAPDLGPTPVANEVQRPADPPLRRKLAVAAAFLLACGAALASYVVSDRTDTEPAASVIAGPALLGPQAGSGIEITDQQFTVGPAFELGGAVIAPDGTVFGLGNIATQTLDTVPPTYEERIVAGLQAWSAEDGSAPTQFRRGIHVGCGTLSVTTGQGPRWPATLETLADGIEVTPLGITVNLPDGWRSLGAATTSDTYTARLTATLQGQPYRLSVRQAIEQPVGRFLSSTETNPVDLSQGQHQIWHVAGGTTPGWNSLVAVKDTTLIELSGPAPLEVLLTVLDAMQPVPADNWLATSVESSEPVTMTVEGNAPTGCQQQLTIVE